MPATAAARFRKPNPVGSGGLLGENKEEAAAVWRLPGDIRVRRLSVLTGPVSA